jgi:hypothetical protein
MRKITAIALFGGRGDADPFGVVMELESLEPTTNICSDVNR